MTRQPLVNMAQLVHQRVLTQVKDTDRPFRCLTASVSNALGSCLSAPVRAEHQQIVSKNANEPPKSHSSLNFCANDSCEVGHRNGASDQKRTFNVEFR